MRHIPNTLDKNCLDLSVAIFNSNEIVIWANISSHTVSSKW